MTNLPNNEDKEFIAVVKSAINLTLQSQENLLKNGRVERNFTTHLANAISESFKMPGIQIDPFYNRHLGASKRLNGNLIEVDIAIHARDTDENNLLVIELETLNRPTRDDIWKLEGLTTDLDGYGYKLGLYLVVGIENKAGQIISEEWYKNGEIIK